ncbi:MAG: HAD hydrolase-like protein [Candidatus Lokiarchaeota archaeon]|nr:HAD hydrolase-like protein [Candidatus Lokiarchaeota archaeon]
MNEKIVISFDLDFTLINNQEGILNSFDSAFKKYKIPQIVDTNFKRMIGLPLEEIFSKITDIKSEKLITAFRKYYKEKGLYQVELYPGVIQLLKILKENKMSLGVVTSKKKELAVKLLKNLQIYQYFDFVIGETHEIKSKTDLKIKNFFHERFPEHNYIIVGDHLSDRRLAEMLNCRFIGILTGNHSKQELSEGSSVPVLIVDNITKLSLDKLFHFQI